MNDTELKEVEMAAAKAGKYLTFKIDAEEYGVEILKVKEIIGLMNITKVPRTPAFVRGVINLRGMVIPVVDLRKKFGMQSIEDTKETCIIVMEIVKNGEPISMGILVDAVSEVLDIAGQEIESTPSFGVEIDMGSILGMAKTKGSVKILLNIDRVLTEEDIKGIADLKCALLENEKI